MTNLEPKAPHSRHPREGGGLAAPRLRRMSHMTRRHASRPRNKSGVTISLLFLFTFILSLPAWAQEPEALPAPPPPQAPAIICPNIASAEAGDAPDQYYMGKAYDEGYCGVAVDKKEAEHWYRLAAEQSHMLAAYELGETWFAGDGFDPDYPEAKKWFLKAAEKGHGLSQLRMGFLSAESHFTGLTPDYAEAEKWFLKAALQNAGDAQFRLGNFYNNYKEPRDYGKGFIWLKRAADGGHRVAMYDLSRMFREGRGVAKNMEYCLQWMKKAADLDLLSAQMNLSEMYASGKEVPKDPVESLKWTLKIAFKPTASIFWLNKAGDIFFEGWEGMPKNYPTARKFYERAALKNDRHALERLSTIYAQGLGVAKDEAKAAEYTKKAKGKE